jgi:hypothetical protein
MRGDPCNQRFDGARIAEFGGEDRGSHAVAGNRFGQSTLGGAARAHMQRKVVTGVGQPGGDNRAELAEPAGDEGQAHARSRTIVRPIDSAAVLSASLTICTSTRRTLSSPPNKVSAM